MQERSIIKINMLGKSTEVQPRWGTRTFECEAGVSRARGRDCFHNLESFVSADGGMEKEPNHRLRKRATVMTEFSGLWRNRGMSSDVKVGILETIVIPMVQYGLESWILNARERRVEGFENVIKGSLRWRGFGMGL